MVVYVGSTVNPRKRFYQHLRNGITGCRVLRFVKNMMVAEDKLLKKHSNSTNKHRLSGAQPSKGYVYICKGGRNSCCGVGKKAKCAPCKEAPKCRKCSRGCVRFNSDNTYANACADHKCKSPGCPYPRTGTKFCGYCRY